MSQKHAKAKLPRLRAIENSESQPVALWIPKIFLVQPSKIFAFWFSKNLCSSAFSYMDIYFFFSESIEQTISTTIRATFKILLLIYLAFHTQQRLWGFSQIKIKKYILLKYTKYSRTLLFFLNKYCLSTPR